MLAVCCTFLSATLASCGLLSTRKAPDSSRAITPADYPIVWLQTPYLDLDRPDGTFIRAVFESRVRSFQLGDAGVFPGFNDASPNGSYSYGNRQGGRYDKPHTIYMWALAANSVIKRPTALRADSVASVCMSTPGSGYNNDAAAFSYRRGRVSPPSRQRGPDPTPATNVYGDWQIVEINLDMPLELCATPPASLPKTNKSSPGWPAD